MICSMTAFARTQNQGTLGHLVCEIRSINHRYLEISVSLPEPLRVLEMPIRDCIRQYVTRGKIECMLRYRSDLSASLLTVNLDMVKALVQACEQIARVLKNNGIVAPAEILRFPGVLETKEVDASTLQTEILHTIKSTVTELIAAREREGKELSHFFLQRLELMQQELTKVRKQLPQVMQMQKDRLLKRFTDVKLELDPARLEQEMLIFAQKIDVAEEVERTETHIAEIRRILQQGGAIGRRLDFLLQELNREANTLGSKSGDTLLTHAAVEMKVLIEQIREQVQNIE